MPERRLAAFPHQLSGGMSQRVMIAMALACNPRLLIADEPTTALDVTIQAQILDLLVRLQRERGMALMLITHDLGVVAETAERVTVMYAGQQVETRPVERLFAAPHHPYTAALLAALPARTFGKARLATIPGVVPGVGDRPPGCLFAPRCPFVEPRCEAAMPQLMPDGDGRVRCYRPLVDGLPEDGRGATRPELLAAEAPALEAVRRMSEPVLEAIELTRHYALTRGLFGRRRSCGRWTACRSRWRPARRWRWWASPAAASRRWRAS